MNNLNSMSNPISQAGIYTDLNSLAQLRAKATSTSGDDKKQAAHEVAKQFESLFLQMMLKSMRDASPASDSGGGQQTRFYQDMFDKQIALDLSNRQQGGIGLASTIESQLGGRVGTKMQQPDTLKPAAPIKLNPLPNPPFSRAVAALHPQQLQQPQPLSAVPEAATFKPQSAQQFVQALWPHAKRAAAKLGVAPEVLIAQSALETGWGQKMMHDTTGKTANNLFGIKADSQWTGVSVKVPTLEYRDGVAAKQQATFRAYPSVADSFEDYTKFLQNSPRYQSALAQAGDKTAYLQHLQQARYATDPAYAEKIQAITQRVSFIQTVAGLKHLDLKHADLNHADLNTTNAENKSGESNNRGGFN